MKDTSFLDLIVWHEQVKDGICPIDSRSTKREVKSRLDCLSAAESRKTKRKFRKLWRSATITVTEGGKLRGKMKFKSLGCCGHPTKRDMIERKTLVLISYIKKCRKKFKDVLDR